MSFSLVKPILTILKPEESLLLLYLATEFFQCGHIGEILGSIELIACSETSRDVYSTERTHCVARCECSTSQWQLHARTTNGLLYLLLGV